MGSITISLYYITFQEIFKQVIFIFYIYIFVFKIEVHHSKLSEFLSAFSAECCVCSDSRSTAAAVLYGI